MPELQTTPPQRLVVAIADLLRRDGSQRDFSGALVLDDLVAGEFSIVGGALSVELLLEASGEGVLAAGAATGEWTGPCRRCLEPIVEPIEIDVHEVFQRGPSEGESWPIDEDRIDLAPMLRETALLSLPLVPLCRDDCVGPEPERFPTTMEVDVDLEDADSEALDPRWAALDGLRFDE